MTTVNPGPYRKVTGLWFALFCLLFLAVGVSGIYVGESTNGFWEGHKGAQTFIENLGGFIVAAVVLGIVWELVGKRAFLQEILATTGLANDVERTGLLGAGVDFTNSPNWGSYFATLKDSTSSSSMAAPGGTLIATGLPHLPVRGTLTSEYFCLIPTGSIYFAPWRREWTWMQLNWEIEFAKQGPTSNKSVELGEAL
ncbi:hypothetical protein ACFQZ4_50665 [Catellatospora coxensis]